MANVVNDLHRIEVLPAGVGRADVLAASARGASPAVDEVAPREVGVVHSAEGFHIQIVQQHRLPVGSPSQRFHRGHGPQIVKEDVGERHDQVHVLGQRNQEEEHANGQHVSPIRTHHNRS